MHADHDDMAQLVQALLFQLIDSGGLVAAELGTGGSGTLLDPYTGDLIFRHLDAAVVDSRLEWTHPDAAAGDASVSLIGPRSSAAYYGPRVQVQHVASGANYVRLIPQGNGQPCEIYVYTDPTLDSGAIYLSPGDGTRRLKLGNLAASRAAWLPVGFSAINFAAQSPAIPVGPAQVFAGPTLALTAGDVVTATLSARVDCSAAGLGVAVLGLTVVDPTPTSTNQPGRIIVTGVSSTDQQGGHAYTWQYTAAATGNHTFNVYGQKTGGTYAAIGDDTTLALSIAGIR